MLTEFGGIAYRRARDAADGPGDPAQQRAWGYSNAASGDEFGRRFRDLVVAVVETPLFSGFCYTQFADTFQEVNGLLDAERRPKIPLADIAAAVRHPRTYIAGAA